MAITKERKEQIIKSFGKDEKDTGKTEVQIAILTEEILQLTEHMKVNKKDKHSKLGLYKKVSQRASLLKYLKSESEERYKELLEALNLRK
ncbi:MAG: 30S ribosomal protein S15 [Candidatus Tyloplasma litorale]|nr:MAG: 30S ribosomal protein S15 [Mycoplasmatales bacterium]